MNMNLSTKYNIRDPSTGFEKKYKSDYSQPFLGDAYDHTCELFQLDGQFAKNSGSYGSKQPMWEIQFD